MSHREKKDKDREGKPLSLYQVQVGGGGTTAKSLGLFQYISSMVFSFFAQAMAGNILLAIVFIDTE